MKLRHLACDDRKLEPSRSRSTSSRGPWRLIYYEAYVEETDARGREKYLKSGAGRRLLQRQSRHYFAKHSPRKREAGLRPREAKPFTRLGHEKAETTQLYTHVMQKPGLGVRSPLDGLKE